jgi:hypothetical protein
MADGLQMLLAGEDTLETEAVLKNIAELVIFALGYVEALRNRSK